MTTLERTTTTDRPPALTETEKDGALAQERHHYVDLDMDSAHTMPGCLTLPLPAGTKAA